jgi:hypothetical protein
VLAGFIVLLVGAVVTLVRFGAPALVLWLAFSALTGGVLLFWESLRTALDPDALGDEPVDGTDDEVESEFEARKRNALRALRDLEFEHSIGRISDQDFAALNEKYRAEARAAMEALDKSLASYLGTAETIFGRAAEELETLRNEGAVEAQPARKKSKKKRAAEAKPSAKPEDATPPTSEAAPNASDDAGSSESGSDTATATATATARRTCTSCETSNEPDATFCKKCGARLVEA